MRKTPRRGIVVLISMIAILSLVLAACADDDENGGDNGNGDAPIATSTPEDTEAADPTPEGDEEEEEATDEPDDAAGAGDPAAGEAIYNAQCASCHSIDGSEGLGPTWQGLWMSEVPLEDGSTVTADEAYITESIQEPTAKVHQGFQPVMPEFDLDDDEIASVIAFIQTLE